MKTSEIIRAAIPIVQRGWCQGMTRDFNDNVCVLGGLMEVTGCWAPALQAMSVYAREQGFECAVHFNNYGSGMNTAPLSPDLNSGVPITQEDVLVMMEKTAIGLEECGE